MMKVSVSNMRIILASSSPRRQELMKEMNVEFEVVVKPVDERFIGNDNIYEQSMEISKRKAKAVFDGIDDDVIVIGSDTIVLQDGVIYGKPKDYNDAVNMLNIFSDHKHEVISSLCVLVRKDGQIYEDITYDKCDVYVDKMTIDEINEWINSNDVYSKAGAYAIQEGFGKYIKKIDGDYFSIVGFPIHKLYNILKKYI